MNMTNKQRKALWICVGIVVASYVGRSIIDSARQAAYYQQQAMRAAQQRAYAKEHPPAPARAPSVPVVPAKIATPASAPNPAVAPAVETLSGIWRGRTALPGRGICTLTIELHEGTPGHFTGFSTLGCGNFGPLMSKEDRNPAAATLNRMSPAAEIVSGAMENGTIHLTVDKTVSTNSNGCAATSFNLTPFAKQIAAEWQEGTCQGGRILLGRAKS